MKTLILIVSVLATLAVAPSAGYADEIPGDVAVVDVEQVADPEPAVADTVGAVLVNAGMVPIDNAEPQAVPAAPIADPYLIDGTQAEPAIPVDDFAGAVQTIGGLVAVMGAITPVIVETVKVAWPGAFPWAVRLLAVLIGALGGLFVGLGWFGSVPYSIGAAILAGAAGGGGFMLAKWGSQSVRGSNTSGRGFGNITTMIAIAAAGVLLIFMIGCGTVFTVKQGDAVRWDVKPTTPAHAVVLVEDAEVCRVNVPDGTIAISNDCPAGQVSTMDTTGKIPTCVSNPCPPGLSFVFLSTGLSVCQ